MPKISAVYHLSDVHARIAYRQQEYLEVFDKLYARLTSETPGVIVICGNLCHNNQGCYLAETLLVNLSKIMPVVIISGNNDIELKKYLNKLNIPNVHYLPDDDVYNHSDISFITKFKDFKSTRTKIGLFNGDFDEDDFKGFDYVMLGGSSRKYLNDTIAYSGPLLNQEYSNIVQYGFIKWDLESQESKFISIPNDYGYVVINEDTKHIPKKPRVTITSQNEDVLEQLEDYDVQECIKIVNIGNEIKEKNNIIDTTLNYDEFIKKWILERKAKTSVESIDFILKMNSKYLSTITSSVKKHTSYRLKKLTFSNMFSYSKDNTIVFDEVILGLISVNGFGKSSVIDILLYSLFGKCLRGNSKLDVLNNESNSFICKIEFDIGKTTYFICRTGKRKNKTLTVNVEFKTKDTKLTGESNTETNTIIQSYIGSFEEFVNMHVNLHQGFVDLSQPKRREFMCSLLNMDIFEQLYAKSNKKKKELVSNYKFVKNEYNEEEQNALEDKYDALQQDIKKKEKEVKSYQEYEKYKDTLDKCSGITPEELKKQYDACQLSLNELKATQTKLKSLIIDVKEVTSQELQSKRNDLTSLIEKRTSLQHRIDIGKLRTNINTIALLCAKRMKLKYSKTEHDLIVKQLKAHINTDVQCDKLKNELERSKDVVRKLDKTEYNPECKYCTNNPFVKDAIVIKDGLPKLQQQFDAILVSKKEYDILRETENTYIEHQALDTEYYANIKLLLKENNDSLVRMRMYNPEMYMKLEQTIMKMKLFILKMETQHDQYTKNELNKSKLEVIEHKIEKLVSEMKQLKVEMDYVSNIKLNGSIDEVSEILKNIQNKKASLEKQRVELGVLENKIETLEKKRTQVRNIKEELDRYKLYTEAMSKDGIPNMLINNFIPIIEGQVNNILSSICNFTIEMTNDSKNIDVLIVRDDQKHYNAQTASGFEKFVTNLVIQIVLSKLSTSIVSNIFVIDEMASLMDEHNRGKISVLFAYLKSQFDIVLIGSHLDTLRDYVDKCITIKKVSGFSSIC